MCGPTRFPTNLNSVATSRCSRPTSCGVATGKILQNRNLSSPARPCPIDSACPMCEPYVPTWASDHGADPIILVSPLRPQPADLRAEYHVREARKLRQSHSANLAY